MTLVLVWDGEVVVVLCLLSAVASVGVFVELEAKVGIWY